MNTTELRRLAEVALKAKVEYDANANYDSSTIYQNRYEDAVYALAEALSHPLDIMRIIDRLERAEKICSLMAEELDKTDFGWELNELVEEWQKGQV